MSSVTKGGHPGKITYNEKMKLPDGSIVTNRRMESGYWIATFFGIVGFFVVTVVASITTATGLTTSDAVVIPFLASGPVSFIIGKISVGKSYPYSISDKLVHPLKLDKNKHSVIQRQVATVPVILDSNERETARGGVGEIVLTSDNLVGGHSYIPYNKEILAPTHMLTETLVAKGKKQYVQLSWEESPLYRWDIMFEQTQQLRNHNMQKHMK